MKDLKYALAAIKWFGAASVLIVFFLYVLGYVIWHVYLSRFGISPNELSEQAIFSASICYAFMVGSIAAPLAIFFYKTSAESPRLEKGAIVIIFCFWAFLLEKMRILYFPGQKGAPPEALPIVVLVALVHVLVIKVLRRKNVAKASVEFFSGFRWIWAYLFAVSVINLYMTDMVSLEFLNQIVLFYVAIPIFDLDKKGLFDDGSMHMWGLKVFVLIAFVISNVYTFASKQFEVIPSDVGGGRLEVVDVHLSSSRLAGDLSSNGFLVKDQSLAAALLILRGEHYLIVVPRGQKRAVLIKSDSVNYVSFNAAHPN